MAVSWTVIAVALSIQLAFSGWHVLGGIALKGKHGVNAFVFALYRESAASLFMFLVALCAQGKEETMKPARHLKKSTTLPLLLAAGACSFGNVVGTVFALTLIPSDLFSTYQPTIPVFTTALAVAFGYESLTRLIAVGIATSVAGAILVETLSSSSLSGGSSNLLGNLITVGQCVSMASLIIVTKPLLKLYTPLTVTAWYYSIGSVLTLATALAARLPIADFFWTDIEPWLALVYAALVATVYAYEAYSWIIQRASPTLVSAFSTLQPLFTVLLNFIFVGHGVGGTTVAAGAVVVLGLAITVYAKIRRENGKGCFQAAEETETENLYEPLQDGDLQNPLTHDGDTNAVQKEHPSRVAADSPV